MTQPNRFTRLIVSGSSAAGKNTIITQVLYYAKSFALAKSVTTRPERAGDGDKYIRRPRPEFEEMIQAGEFLEWAEHFGHLYGTPVSVLRHSGDIVFEVDTVGAAALKERLPDAHSLFLLVRTPEELERRRKGRNSNESPEQTAMRQAKAYQEAAAAGSYDSWLINDNIDATAKNILGLITALRFGNKPVERTFRNMENLAAVQAAFSQVAEPVTT